MDTYAFDALVIGAGIAGATTAAHLSADRRTALIEAEEAPGYHTTGRSAAMWTGYYGPSDVTTLGQLSRPFLDAPPAGFTETPLLAPRGSLTIATAAQASALETLLGTTSGLRVIPLPELHARVPALRPGHTVLAAIEDDACDIDVAALLQGYLKLHRTRGGALAVRSRAGRIDRRDGRWHVEVTGGAVFTADILVNAAGAWGDDVAKLAGVAPLGLIPKRRTAAIIDPAPFVVKDWPMINDFDEEFYCRPEARTRLMVSPADETPMHPHDVQPDELDIAVGIEEMQRALAIEVRRVERSWAGLRTFTPDGSLAIGWDGAVEDFFWAVGQGGYGILTSPAAGRLAADLIAHRYPGTAAAVVKLVDPNRFAV